MSLVSLLGCDDVVASAEARLAPPKPTAQLRGRVVAIADGDTLTLLVGREQVRVRLYGIDAPEKRQAFGERAKQQLAGCAFGRDAVVRVVGHDRYRRVIGEVVVAGRSCNLEQVERGLAWWYRRYAPDDRALAVAETRARSERRGLWRDVAPTPPWAFRHPGRR